MSGPHKVKNIKKEDNDILPALSGLTFTRVTRRNGAGPPGLLVVAWATPGAALSAGVVFTLTLQFLETGNAKPPLKMSLHIYFTKNLPQGNP